MCEVRKLMTLLNNNTKMEAVIAAIYKFNFQEPSIATAPIFSIWVPTIYLHNIINTVQLPWNKKADQSFTRRFLF